MNWSVTVRRNDEEIVTIETNALSGRDISVEDEAAIREAARHLLAFIGDPAPFERSADFGTHRYSPNSKYPWFCEHCGYREDEKLKHT